MIQYAPESALFGLINHMLTQQDDTEKELANIDAFTEFVTDVVDYWNQKNKNTNQMTTPRQNIIGQWYR